MKTMADMMSRLGHLQPQNLQNIKNEAQDKGKLGDHKVTADYGGFGSANLGLTWNKPTINNLKEWKIKQEIAPRDAAKANQKPVNVSEAAKITEKEMRETYGLNKAETDALKNYTKEKTSLSYKMTNLFMRTFGKKTTMKDNSVIDLADGNTKATKENLARMQEYGKNNAVLLSALEKLPSPAFGQKECLYRGMRLNDQELADVIKGYEEPTEMVGGVAKKLDAFQEPNFISTSINENVATRFALGKVNKGDEYMFDDSVTDNKKAVLFVFHPAISNSQAKSVQGISVSKNEQEFLYPAGTRFRYNRHEKIEKTLTDPETKKDHIATFTLIHLEEIKSSSGNGHSLKNPGKTQ